MDAQPPKGQRRTRKTKPSRPAGKFGIRDRSELDYVPLPQWLVRNVIRRNSQVLLYGPSGSFKSLAALDLCLSICTSKEVWFDSQPIEPRHGKAIYIGGENISGVRARTEAWERAKNGGDQVAGFHHAADVPQPSEIDAFIQELTPRCASADLIVFDTVTAGMVGLSQDAVGPVSDFIAGMERLGKAFDATVMMLHHSGKNKRKGARGSTGFRAAPDTEIFVDRHGNGGEAHVTVTKQREGDPGHKFNVALDKRSHPVTKEYEVTLKDGDPVPVPRTDKKQNRTANNALQYDAQVAALLAKLTRGQQYSQADISKILTEAIPKVSVATWTGGGYLKALRKGDTQSAKFFVNGKWGNPALNS